MANRGAVPIARLMETVLEEWDLASCQGPYPQSVAGANEDELRLLPTRDSAASAPSGTDVGIPAGAPTPAPDGGCGDLFL